MKTELAETSVVTPISLDRWHRSDTYRWFRDYGRPHYAITCRVDVTRLMARKAEGVSPYIGCLYAVGHGLNAVPELRVRFRADGTVVRHESIGLSFTVPRDTGGFAYSYQPFVDEFDVFDRAARANIAKVRSAKDIREHAERTDAVAYLSCLPWLDFTALDHAVPGPDDCIPRLSWGKIVEQDGRADMSLNVQVHHAVTDGEHVGALVSEIQTALDGF
ncbi:chloramphenicol acetyltransferase [Sagittula sp. NFXS13]|uniref:CatA-like O-acetyltransferase n=1 Tax=Sagittula sp. NFXS13 TaxID=2819095 RepID=UPI0032DFDBD6